VLLVEILPPMPVPGASASGTGPISGIACEQAGQFATEADREISRGFDPKFEIDS